MNILAIETTGALASVALIDEAGQVSMETSDQKMNHLQHLMPMVDQILSKRGLEINDLTYIAVSEGPGSFTGIRIGVSSARALAQALGLETIGVPTLKSFLYHVPEYKGVVCPIFDARRNQVYGGAYQWSDSKIKEVVAGDAYDLNGFLELLGQAFEPGGAGQTLPAQTVPGAAEPKAGEVTFFGDGIIPYREQIEAWQRASSNNNIRVLFAADDVRLQKASSIARLALELCRSGTLKSLYDLKPVYMRKAEAERKLEGK
ncbi:MAG: tsaB [Bacillota bacterium]|jgi:tRNA threonylcarbamoyladenosine biosynthesis protein TsaB|nr:tsaB [Bacillota bacterium]